MPQDPSTIEEENKHTNNNTSQNTSSAAKPNDDVANLVLSNTRKNTRTPGAKSKSLLQPHNKIKNIANILLYAAAAALTVATAIFAVGVSTLGGSVIFMLLPFVTKAYRDVCNKYKKDSIFKFSKKELLFLIPNMVTGTLKAVYNELKKSHVKKVMSVVGIGLVVAAALFPPLLPFIPLIWYGAKIIEATIFGSIRINDVKINNISKPLLSKSNNFKKAKAAAAKHIVIGLISVAAITAIFLFPPAIIGVLLCGGALIASFKNNENKQEEAAEKEKARSKRLSTERQPAIKKTDPNLLARLKKLINNQSTKPEQNSIIDAKHLEYLNPITDGNWTAYKQITGDTNTPLTSKNLNAPDTTSKSEPRPKRNSI